MYDVYEDERIPVQIRRLILFTKTCQQAKKYPDEFTSLPTYSKIAFGIIYSKKDRKYTAFGSVFEYAHTRQEVLERILDEQPHDEQVMCAITTKRQAFTSATRTPLGLLIKWNRYVKDKKFMYIDGRLDTFFKVNDELEVDYPPHKFFERLVATKNLPLWDNQNI